MPRDSTSVDLSDRPLDRACVPNANDAGFALEPKNRDRARFKSKSLGVLWRKSQPRSRENPKCVPVPEHGNIAARRESSCQNPLRTNRNLLGVLSAGRTIVKEVPRRPLSSDLCCRLSLVVAVIPLPEFIHALGLRQKPGQLARSHRAPHRACENQCEGLLAKHRRQQLAATLTLRRQREVGARCVLPAETPFSFAVADKKDPLRHRTRQWDWGIVLRGRTRGSGILHDLRIPAIGVKAV
jgi:hypothetical protein